MCRSFHELPCGYEGNSPFEPLDSGGTQTLCSGTSCKNKRRGVKRMCREACQSFTVSRWNLYSRRLVRLFCQETSLSHSPARSGEDTSILFGFTHGPELKRYKVTLIPHLSPDPSRRARPRMAGERGSNGESHSQPRPKATTYTDTSKPLGFRKRRGERRERGRKRATAGLGVFCPEILKEREP